MSVTIKVCATHEVTIVDAVPFNPQTLFTVILLRLLQYQVVGSREMLLLEIALLSSLASFPSLPHLWVSTHSTHWFLSARLTGAWWWAVTQFP